MARILVIDDDETLLATFEQALSAMGHSVATAADGARGERLLRTNSFDVVVTDIVMPDRDGLEIITLVRREFPRVKVIAMSGYGTRGGLYLGLARRLGADRTLEKPFSLRALSDAIGAVL